MKQTRPMTDKEAEIVYDLKLCKVHGTMTNHYPDGTCAKCMEERIKNNQCTRCGRPLTPYKDPKNKKVDPYSWQCLSCAPHLVLSIG